MNGMKLIVAAVQCFNGKHWFRVFMWKTMCLCRGGVIKISGYIIWFNNTPTTGRCQLKAKSKVGSWVECVAALEPLLGRKILKLLKFIRLGSILFHLTRSLGKYGFV